MGLEHEGRSDHVHPPGGPLEVSNNGNQDLWRRTGPVDSVDGQIQVSRPTCTVSQLRDNLCYVPPEKFTLMERVSRSLRSSLRCSPACVWALVLLRMPVFGWLPRYQFKDNLVPDFIAGFTVGVMHLPQGMGYALLAQVDPIVGLYTAFFPVLIYVIFGSSRHISMGTFSVGCLMTGNIVLELGSEGLISERNTNVTNSSGTGSTTEMPQADEGEADEVQFTNLQVAVALGFMVGCWQLLFGLLKLGKLSVFLPDTLISGFSTGAACHVFTSQVPSILGIKAKKFSGAFYLLYTYRDIFMKLSTINLTTFAMSAVSLACLSINSVWLKDWMKKFTKIPIPVDLFAVIIGTVVIYLTQWDKTSQVKVVGHIPTGLPGPIAPDHRLFSKMFLQSFILAIVVYVICFSMAKIFSKKHGYKVDASQELLAGGLSNVFGSFFSCVPSCASLSRSMVQEVVGGKTQVVSLVSCSFLVVVLLFVGPCFKTLPICVLATIIMVALKGLFLQVYDLLAIWKQSKGEGVLWILSFAVTVFVDLDYGLLIGGLFNIMLLLKRNNQPTVTRFGWVPKTEIYVDINTYHSAVAVPGVCLCHVSGALHSANVETFTEQLLRATGLDTTKIIAAKAKRERKEKKSRNAALHTDDGVTTTYEDTTVEGEDSTDRGSPRRRMDQIISIENSGHNLSSQVIKKRASKLFMRNSSSYACEDSQHSGVDRINALQGHENKAYLPDDVHVMYPTPQARPFGLQQNLSHSSKGLVVPAQDVSLVVLCLSGVGWMDVSAAEQMGSLYTEHDNAGIALALAGTNDAVMKMLRRCGVLDTIPENRLFHSIHDAVTFYLADGLHSKPQPSPFVGDKDDVEGPPPIIHDARPAVVPDMLHSHTDNIPTVPVPSQQNARHLAEHGLPMERASENLVDAADQTQRKCAQSPRRKKGRDGDIGEKKRAKDPGNNRSQFPTTGQTVQHMKGDFNTRF